MPVVLLAVVGGALLVLASRQRGARLFRSRHGMASVAPIVVAVVVVAFYAVSRLLQLRGMPDPFPGFTEFGMWDIATVALLVPGALALSRIDTRLTISLVGSAVIMLALYYWVEPMDSRYLVQLLAFLVPVSAASVELVNWKAFGSAGLARRTRQESLAITGAAVMVVLAVGLLATQARMTFQPVGSLFREAAYPAAVAQETKTNVRPTDDFVVAALPWPAYFHIGGPTWGAEALLDPTFPQYVGADKQLLVVCDAAMRYHYPQVAAALEASTKKSGTFAVPATYLYGYDAISDSKPVALYRLTAREMSGLIAIGRIESAQNR
jgi:hypothetical protein